MGKFTSKVSEQFFHIESIEETVSIVEFLSVLLFPKIIDNCFL